MNFGIAEISIKDRTATFTWNPVSGATGYALEIGRTTGGTEFTVITLQGPATTLRATDLPVGVSFSRVKAQNASGTSAAATELRFAVPDLRDIIEALFFATGPNRYVLTNGTSEPPTDFMKGWPQGSNIQTRVAGLNDQEYTFVERSLLQIAEATNGAVRGTITQRLSDAAALGDAYVPGVVKVLVDPDMQKYCGNQTVAGCGRSNAPLGAVIESAIIAGKSPTSGNLFIHEFGHAVLGLRHIQWGPGSALGIWPGLPHATMFPSSTNDPAELSSIELDAIKAVYAAGFRAGTNRSALFAAGLINNRF